MACVLVGRRGLESVSAGGRYWLGTRLPGQGEALVGNQSRKEQRHKAADSIECLNHLLTHCPQATLLSKPFQDALIPDTLAQHLWY